MNQSVKLSVITPSFNQSDFIGRTIMSVLSQETDAEFEYIIIDGASTDGTIEILKQFTDKLTWVSSPDDGQADAVNKGIDEAHGEIIGWLNSDDVYLPETLKKAICYFDEHPECQWLYGLCNIIDDNDREVRRWLTKYKNVRIRRFHFNKLLLENCISQPAVFFRKSAFYTAGKLDTKLPYAMDYDLWLRLAKLYQPGMIRDYLASFRVHRQSKSMTNSRQQFIEQYKIHKKYDQRKSYLFLHRMLMNATIFGYWLISKIRRSGN